MTNDPALLVASRTPWTYARPVPLYVALVRLLATRSAAGENIRGRSRGLGEPRYSRARRCAYE